MDAVLAATTVAEEAGAVTVTALGPVLVDFEEVDVVVGAVTVGGGGRDVAATGVGDENSREMLVKEAEAASESVS